MIIGHFTKIGAQVFEQSHQATADKIAADLTTLLDEWHSLPEVYDDDLDAQIHKWYADILTNRQRKVWPPKNMPYFSPSSANSDKRELYERLVGGKKDGGGQPPHQGRWTRIGTAIGDVIQRDILFAEKHVINEQGARHMFSFERNALGEPMFEDFAKKAAPITHNGKTFALLGTCDGILQYVTEDGEVLRVGLEVKSKQTTAAKTSDYSTRNGPDENHVKQVTCYSIMYNVDYYVILYVNCAKKGWVMTEEDYAKTPDIKAFGIAITDEMRNGVLDYLTDVLTAVEAKEPPPLDVRKWTFNNFKTACATGLSDEELTAIERQVDAVQQSTLKDYEKREYVNVLADIKRIRAEVINVE